MRCLLGRTRGYRKHPQLERFKSSKAPVAVIRAYLAAALDESRTRGYSFDGTKIAGARSRARIAETRGQLLYEWAHLKRKLRRRSPTLYRRIAKIREPRAHPLFRIVAGPVRDWERTTGKMRRMDSIEAR